MNKIIIVRFGELSTKGKNIKDFIRKLADNIKVTLKEFTDLVYAVKHDHIYITIESSPYEKIKEKLVLVPGIRSFSLTEGVEENIDAIVSKCLEVAKNNPGKTFKVFTKRIDKLFPFHSDEVNRKVASAILKNTDLKVDVHNPELPLSIMIREGAAYIYTETTIGLGGYPLGVAGKSLMMLSGGIDSPVAAYLLMKRGVKLEMIHFAAPPYTSERVIDKITDLIHVLNTYQPEIKLYIVPFTKLQEEIYKAAGTSYAITIMRRMMIRIAERVARRHHDFVLSNGESIGQVASQTLQSMVSIEECATMPIIRPLATYDKNDIIAISQKIGTYDISIRPYEDCCTIFKVKDPTTCPHLDKIKTIEEKFDYITLVNECVNNVETRLIKIEEDEF